MTTTHYFDTKECPLYCRPELSTAIPEPMEGVQQNDGESVALEVRPQALPVEADLRHCPHP